MSVTAEADARAAIDEERARIEEMQGGQSIEAMAENGKEDEDGQQFLDFGDALNLSVKGKKPTESEVKIKAISRGVKGQLGDTGDDEVVTLLVTARLDEIRFVNSRDGSGKITKKVRRHVFEPIGCTVLTPEQADKALGVAQD